MKTTRTITADRHDNDNDFILSVNGVPTYKTVGLSSDEADEAEYNTSEDWEHFFKTGSYQKI